MHICNCPNILLVLFVYKELLKYDVQILRSNHEDVEEQKGEDERKGEEEEKRKIRGSAREGEKS